MKSLTLERRLISFAYILLTSGCATPYVPPSNGPTAQITFVNGALRPLHVSFYEKSEFCTGRRLAGKLPPSNRETYTVPADGTLTFEFYQTESADNRYCLTNLRFTPTPSGRYVFETNQANARCVWRMQELSEGQPAKAVALKNVGWNTAFDNNGSFCRE